MGRRVLHLLLAVLAIVVVTLPLIALRADSGGWRFAILPSLQLGGAALAVGLLWLFLQETGSRWIGGAAAAAVRPLAGRPWLEASFLAAFVAFVAVLPLFASGTWTGLVLETLVYVTIASGLNIALGMTGLLVLGH